MKKTFIDKLRIFVQAGSGAAGNPIIGGKGGDGGNVFVEADRKQTLWSLLQHNPLKRYKAEHGKEANNRRGFTVGRNGDDLIIRVPTGVSVFFSGQGNASNGVEHKRLGDLDHHGQKLLVAQGGMGGIPHTSYLGTPGQAHSLVLDLKLIADFGLIGFPNAGKSTLLKTLSGCPAKIADYPFTTLSPQVALCKYPDHRQVSLTDLPGLADIYTQYPKKEQSGSIQDMPMLKHTNFLKHVEHNSCLILVLDSMGFCKNQHSPLRNPLAVTYLILHQLERWSQGILMGKPVMCVLTKIDLPGAEEAALQSKFYLEQLDSPASKALANLPDELIPRFLPTFESIHLVSAKSGKNLDEFKESLRSRLDEIELRKRKVFLEDQCSV